MSTAASSETAGGATALARQEAHSVAAPSPVPPIADCTS
jgi:hypothetical protein